jgi:hypothetical protein
LSVLAILAGCAAVYNFYVQAFSSANWMTKRQVRKAIGEGDRISAQQAQRWILPGQATWHAAAESSRPLGATPDSDMEEGAR